MSTDKKELIGKLEKISSLYDNAVSIRDEMDNFVPEDNYERKNPIPKYLGEKEIDDEFIDVCDHESNDAVDIMMFAFEKKLRPTEPKKPVIYDCKRPAYTEAGGVKQKLGCLPLVGGFLGVISLLTAITSGNDDPSTAKINWVIFGICVACTAFFFYKLYMAKKKDEEIYKEMLKEHAQKVAEENKKYEEDMKAYKDSCEVYNHACEKFRNDYIAWRTDYLKHLKEEAEISKKLEADRVAAVDKIYEEKFVPAKAELDEYNDLLSKEHLPAVDIITDLIKSNRADDLKEAINLYEDMVYRERQLQLQREQEEQRRREEEMRRQDEERRYQEEKHFRENQERQRQREEQQRRNDEERRFKEEQQARENERRAAERERLATESRMKEEKRIQERKDMYAKRDAEQQQMHTCRKCKKYSSCRNQGKIIGCGAFDPK